MSRLTKNSTPAERGRGCIFAESFTSAEEAIANGGVITADPNFSIPNGATFDGSNYITFGAITAMDSPSFTFMCWIKTPTIQVQHLVRKNWGVAGWRMFMTGSGTIEFDSTGEVGNIITLAPLVVDTWYHIAGTYDDNTGTATLFLNGVQQSTASVVDYQNDGGGDMELPFSGTPRWEGNIRDAKMFNVSLNSVEILSYYNQDIYGYENNLLINLPMDFENHDPTNSQVLDISGNGNHATLPGGTADPVKNTHINGYLFDGTDDYMPFPNPGFIAGSTYTVSIMSQLNSINGDSTWINFGLNNPANEGWVIQENGGAFRLYNAGAGGIAISNVAYQTGQWLHWVVTHDGTDLKVYLNGEHRTTSATFNYGYGTVWNLGTETPGFKPFDGSLASFKLWNTELTPLQIQDLYNKEIKRVNNK